MKVGAVSEHQRTWAIPLQCDWKSLRQAFCPVIIKISSVCQQYRLCRCYKSGQVLIEQLKVMLADVEVLSEYLNSCTMY